MGIVRVYDKTNMSGQKNKKTSPKKSIILGALIITLTIIALAVGLWITSPAVLNPSGIIASKERDLIILTVFLGAIVVLPVFFMLFFVAWRYREGNDKAKYSPDWQNNRWIEGVWWGVPLLIISILGVVAWQSSHELDPYKPLDSAEKPVKVQVVALQWRWLFIYPDEKMASMNELRFPVNTPINFEITADAPMNSFWIPKLGSQVYAMPGMSTQLHLEAHEIGEFEGRSANISGEGFADMHFAAKAVSRDDFENWIKAQQKEANLDTSLYEQLVAQTRDKKTHGYALGDPSLYDTIIMKYMGTQ
jgi:cytochrome o ubiquinol oxidase subunit 2